ncbi:MAG TPA: hypothetical protein VHX16_16565 [Chloroflexota bacterium]|jgi:ketosteroid isomerase-like protein|nr:hypothetical protein [Chloroflexota bacterium]
MSRNHTTIFRESHLQTTSVDVRFPREDVAVVHATWVLSGERGFDGSALPPRNGLVTYLMTREPSGWEIAAFQNTNIEVPPGSALHH